MSVRLIYFSFAFCKSHVSLFAKFNLGPAVFLSEILFFGGFKSYRRKREGFPPLSSYFIKRQKQTQLDKKLLIKKFTAIASETKKGGTSGHKTTRGAKQFDKKNPNKPSQPACNPDKFAVSFCVVSVVSLFLFV